MTDRDAILALVEEDLTAVIQNSPDKFASEVAHRARQALTDLLAERDTLLATRDMLEDQNDKLGKLLEPHIEWKDIP